ncbi:hypothetical protein [Psychroserpens ponticola]|uniref:DUF4286 family protein n=1 Tax=Psychroserpens ponticola TaxID=2932268 RepID=A0ABY7S0Q2_9FLAO|nr:hypothetical protein [Psychroserpens ponticola]WCO02734.1 hypothetical protein MUN68_004365 [Psychroserpens ponticola]
MKISKQFHEHLINTSDMCKTILLTACFLLMLPTITQAQDAEESFILDLTEFTIKQGQDTNFTDGVKKWNKCYKDSKGTNTWNVWHRLQGKGNVYVLSSRLANWADMDKKDAAAKECRTIAISSIIPHIESSEYNVTRYMPEPSRKANMEGMSIVWVNSFKVNDFVAFNEVLKEVTSTIAKKEGANRGYWYSIMGGEGADYFISTPFKDFADLDKDTDSVWKVYESVHGKSKAQDIRKKFNASLEDAWSYTYTLVEDLSMN